MKHFRKISVLFLALIMVLTMGASVFAAGPEKLGDDQSINPDQGKTGVISNGGVKQDGVDSGEKDSDNKSTHGVYSPVENSVRIYKEIVIFNTNSAETLVYLPNITYTYSIAAATGITADKHIIDEYELSATIQDGNADALSTSSATVAYSATSGITSTDESSNNPYVITNQNGKAAKGYFDIAFDPTKFTKPGIYRYVITESAGDNDALRKAAGVTIDKDQYDNKRYLDVYVQYNKDDRTKLEIYGYVLFEDKNDNKNKEFSANPGTAIGAKTNGFVSEKLDGDATSYNREEKDVDIYDTANIKVEKEVKGAMGDKTNKFPFEATIKNANITANAKFSYQVVDEGEQLSTTSTSNPTKDLNASVKIGDASATGADEFKLKDTEYIYIYGVPGKSDVARSVDSVDTKVEVKEFNNTTDTYNVTAKYNSNDVTVTNEETPKATVAAVAEQNVPFTKTEEYMKVTNSMNSISPTNVVMRYAPYLFILAGAALLLVVSRRRKAEQE